MYRKIINDLIEWKESKGRKPLILEGARQVGKTHILRYIFGANHYNNVAYFDFYQNDDLKNLFKSTKDPVRIIEQLAIINKETINKGDTLIIFDEIQECNEALNSLKYFYQDEPDYHIVAAGSLLGITLSNTTFPVGKVNFLKMYPLTFEEFLLATDNANLVKYLESVNKLEPIPDIFFNRLQELIKTYFVIGGMPEPVLAWTSNNDISKVTTKQKEIIKAYTSDFSKHTTKTEAERIRHIWNSIPSQLAKENKKFLYQVIKGGARAREYEIALNWLNDAGLVYKIYSATAPKLPLKAYEDLSAFKIYLHDVGLLSRLANLDSSIIIKEDEIFTEFKGALTENYCFSQLVIKNETLNYFTFGSSGYNYEIDALLQYKNEIIPIEIKSGTHKNKNSINAYTEKYNPKLRVRISSNNLKLDGNLLNVPIFMVDYLEKLIDTALEELK